MFYMTWCVVSFFFKSNLHWVCVCFLLFCLPASFKIQFSCSWMMYVKSVSYKLWIRSSACNLLFKKLLLLYFVIRCLIVSISKNVHDPSPKITRAIFKSLKKASKYFVIYRNLTAYLSCGTKKIAKIYLLYLPFCNSF